MYTLVALWKIEVDKQTCGVVQQIHMPILCYWLLMCHSCIPHPHGAYPRFGGGIAYALHYKQRDQILLFHKPIEHCIHTPSFDCPGNVCRQTYIV
jgi:hypothetical protein